MYASDTDDKHSVYGGRVSLLGLPVMFSSLTQKFMILSAAEAECVVGVVGI